MKKISAYISISAFMLFVSATPSVTHAQFYDDATYTDDASVGYTYTDDPTYGGSFTNDPSGYGYGSFTDDPSGYGSFTNDPSYGYGGDYGGYNSSHYGYSDDWYPSCGQACIGPTSSAYGMGGTQGYGYGGNYGYGGGYGNYGYTSYGGSQYAAAAYPMYQQPQYAMPMYQQQQPVQNTQWTWGMVTNSPVVYGKSLGTSVDLFGTYPSCVIYFLPTASPYTHGLRWSGINIARATMTGYGQVTGEGYMEIPYDGRDYTLTVWNEKGEMRTCSTQ